MTGVLQQGRRQSSLALSAPRRVAVPQLRRTVTFVFWPGRHASTRELPEHSPVEALRAIARTLGRRVEDLSVRTDDPPLHDVDLMAELEPGVVGPIASITGGMTYPEAHEAMARLQASNGAAA